jgi:hypothetical protein
LGRVEQHALVAVWRDLQRAHARDERRVHGGHAVDDRRGLAVHDGPGGIERCMQFGQHDDVPGGSGGERTDGRLPALGGWQRAQDRRVHVGVAVCRKGHKRLGAVVCDRSGFYITVLATVSTVHRSSSGIMLRRSRTACKPREGKTRCPRPATLGGAP